MGNSLVFFSLPCLTERSNPILAKDLFNKWFKNSDKRYLDKTVQEFIYLNKSQFSFLGVTPIVEGTSNDIKLSFRSENYIGAIPLKSPVNGKPLADFVVFPRFIKESNEKINDYVGIIYLLKEEIFPEFNDSSDLLSKRNIRPPLYFECVKFINLLFDSIRSNWVKFDSKINFYHYPKNKIVWSEYIKKEWNPSRKLDFPCEENWLNKFHNEQQELFYIYNKSKEEINNHSTPIRIRSTMRNKFVYLDKHFEGIEPRKTLKIFIHNSDPSIVKKTKKQGNKIISNENISSKAWRVDFSKIFERYIQFIFKNISVKSGWSILNNIKYLNTSHNKPPWCLKYFEPDILLLKQDNTIVIDAKYKSHLLNLESTSEFLKEEHRSDIHQISAYCAFAKSNKKIGFLCYPIINMNNKPPIKMMYYDNYSQTQISIFLLGIPISYTSLSNIQENLETTFKNIITEEEIFF